DNRRKRGITMAADLTDEVVLADLQTLARDVFANPAAVLTPSSTAADVKGWDSLSHGRFITRVEAHYGITFKMRDVMAMSDVGALIQLIHKRRSELPR